MKKITIYILSLIVISMIAIGGAVLNNVDKNVELDKAVKDDLTLAGLTDYTVSTISCNADECEQVCIQKSGVINTCYKPEAYWVCTNASIEAELCVTEDKHIAYTAEELEAQRDTFEEEARSRVLTRYRINKAKAEQAEKDDKVAGGVHTITQK